MNKKAENIEYDEAPSGHVTFYNYKEPLMKFEGGHGFVGALVFDGESGKIQCHLCGNWYDALSNHIHREHNMDAEYYKKVVGLNKGTALINEKVRASLIKSGLNKRLQNLRQNRRDFKYTHSRATREKIRATLKENRDELKNLRGTCPEQLIDRLQKMYFKLGYTPNSKDVPFIEALTATYGTYREACRVAGIPDRKPGETMYKKPSKYTLESVVGMIHIFHQNNGRLPRITELGNSIASHIRYKELDFRDLCKKTLLRNESYVKSDMRLRYSKDELLTFLRRFEQINGRKPSYSDSRRGLLPNLSTYHYNFGSWSNALKRAFLV